MEKLRGTTIRAYGEWLAAAQEVSRLDPKCMHPSELDIAAALLYVRPVVTSEQSEEVRKQTLIPALRVPLQIATDGRPFLEKNDWEHFSVTGDWNAFGALISSVGLVVGSHESEDNCKPTIWYSSHAYLSGTSVEAYGDVRTVVARSAALLLKIHPSV